MPQAPSVTEDSPHMPPRTKDVKEKEPATPAVRPLIAINADLVTPKNGTAYTKLNVGYLDAIITAGGLPLVLPPLRKENLADVDALLNQCAGIVLTGGADMDPRRNGQATTAAVNPMPARREDADRYLLAKIFERKLTVLGIGLLGVGILLLFCRPILHRWRAFYGPAKPRSGSAQAGVAVPSHDGSVMTHPTPWRTIEP